MSTASLTGSFLQPAESHRSWSEADWSRLFGRFEELGLSWIVLQWAHSDSLEPVLRFAAEKRMKVLVGLAHDESYWQSIAREPDLLEVYFRRLTVQSLVVARENLPLLVDHPSFEGFYIPQEIDDVHWLEARRRRVLFDFLLRLAESLREARPGVRLAISGFSNARADPVTLARFWAELVRHCGIGTVLFQDGIGVGKLDLVHLPLYLAPLREAIEREGSELWPVVENFAQVAGAPVDLSSFRAVPAPLDRLLQQVESASRYSSGEVIAFSVPDYMTPSAGEAAERLFREYLRRLPP
jgi:hypothetical protein